ncbi:MAG: sensor histidine kinase, partial [Calditrichaeota bacterium]|nr:sensor histidine kinase [Calditrichota bacterium]
MKIKDLRSYRSFYKETRHVTDVYDENFIGNFTTDVNGNINKRGWFSLYHGDKDGIGKAKEGIGNFLKTFLNMAKDGQAVYEFLQNAVDAGSTHLTIGWGSDSESGDDYLLVANNGEMFSPEQIRSILNAGSSTKSGSDIGKFGIGFKLAHRLVGKDNGLDELLDNQQPSGPILFSWGNGEIDRLLKSPDLEPVDTDWKNRKLTTHVPGEEPWLFKMLLTCFPCMPENDFINEKIRMVDGETLSSNAFSRREYLALTRWAKRYEDTLSSADYSHGALFFITLGRGKIAELENKNLSEGIAHSIAILNEIVSKKNNSDRGLETVRINNDIITQPNLLFHHLRVRKDVERDVFAHIIFGVNTASELSTKELNQLDEHNDIEFIFGFRPHDEIGNTFRGAPNLYLFFPLSEEVHNFNYILHSNAFDKATSRTFLQAGAIGQDTINSRLLHSLAARMENELDVLYRSQISTNNLSQFLSLYAALISSSSSISEERQWIVKPYLERMNKSLKNVIPVKGVSGELPVMLSTDPSNVRIRRTSVEFDIESVSDIQFRWFYWDYGDDQRILQGAVEKLGIRSFDIVSILNLPEGAQLINEWILAEPSRVKDVFAELRSIPPEGQISGNVKKNLSALKLFRFKNGKHLCDAELIELQDDGYIVLWKGLGDIGHLLEKAGISTTIDDLDEIGSFDSWFNHFASDSQLKNNEYIIHIFNSCIVSATRELYSQKQKLEVFRGIRKLQTEATIERMRKLILFSNKTSSLVPVGNILKENTVDWLNGFVLTADEYHSDLNNYLISNDEDIYTNIIFPLWEDVLAVLVKLDYGSIVKALEDIVSYYEISTDLTKVQKQLGSMPFIPFESQVLKSDQIYVNEKLQDGISATRYEQIQAVCAEKLGLHIPDAAFLPSYTLPPFSRNDSARDIRFKSMDLTLSEADTILHFCSVCDIPILSEMVLVCGESQQYSLHPMELKRSFYTPNTILQKYIEEHFPDELIRLPDELEKFKKMVPLRGESLNEFLISKLEYSDTGDRISLTEALINEGEATVASLSELFDQYRIDMDNRENRENAILAKLLKRLIHIDTVDIDEIRSKIVLFDSKNEIQFDSLGEVNDKIWLDLGDSGIFLSRANLLGLDNTEIQTAQSFVDHLVKGDLFSRKEAELLFKMDIAGFSDDLVSEFLSNLENHHL